VTIVTQQDIKEYGFRNLADILNSVRGFYVTYDRAYHFLGIRGVNRPGDFGGRTLININGHRVNEPIFDSALLGYDLPLDVDLIEKVEVIRAPARRSTATTRSRIVNIVTREAMNLPARASRRPEPMADSTRGRPLQLRDQIHERRRVASPVPTTTVTATQS